MVSPHHNLPVISPHHIFESVLISIIILQVVHDVWEGDAQTSHNNQKDPNNREGSDHHESFIVVIGIDN